MGCETYKTKKALARKSPHFKPASCGVGTVKPGHKGKLYVVKLTKKGKYVWARKGRIGSSTQKRTKRNRTLRKLRRKGKKVSKRHSA